MNLAEAARLRVSLMRRHNLGGTVYRDPKSFMFTVLYRHGVCHDEEVYSSFAAMVCDFLRGGRTGWQGVVSRLAAQTVVCAPKTGA